MAEGILQQSPGQTHVEWKISNFWKRPLSHSSKKSAKSRTGHFLNSPPFSLCDAEWHLRMYPDGRKAVGWTSMYLQKKKSATVHRIAYRIGIKNNNGSELVALQMKHTFEKNICEHGWDQFVKSSELLSSEEAQSSDGSLTVFCTARIAHAKGVPSIYGLVTLSENFKDLYFGRCYSDVTISVQGKEFLAHRNILASRSKVFASMFEHDMVEKTSGIVHIPDCDSDSFEEFLLFLYSGRGDVVSLSNAPSLYETADKYDLKELREECTDCMSREVSVDSFCGIVRLASLHCESDLLKCATDFFIENAAIIIKTPKWQTFLDECPSLGNELFLKFLISQQSDSKEGTSSGYSKA